jgi:putative endonuclease
VAATARWSVYLLRCRDGSLYCGVTTDVDRRVAAHRAGRGARYTRGRAPLELVHVERARGRSDALRREAAWKRLTRPQKLRRLGLGRATSPPAA